MKNLKYILLFTAYLLLAIGCKKEEPQIDRGKKAATDAEAMQMIVGEWKHIVVEDNINPGKDWAYIKEFNADSTYRRGQSPSDYKGGGIVEQKGDYFYTTNHSDSIYYKIREGILYRFKYVIDSTGNILIEYRFTESQEIELYENVLIIQEGAYEREYEKL